PEVAAYSAIVGYLADPRELGEMPEFKLPEVFDINDNMVTLPACECTADSVEILRGPNIKPYPVTAPLAEKIECGVSLKVGDNITTDHIMPAGAKILPLRSNIPEISKHCFTVCDTAFPARAKEMGQSIIIGGANYGQGSSREHAALAPLYLGVKAVITKSFARIHKANLVNAGILPLTFKNEADYDMIAEGDVLVIENVHAQMNTGCEIEICNKTKGKCFTAILEVSDRQKAMLFAGGLLDFVKANG
ncbi:MAG: aconitate hydratase, partial [Clostridia bacterium]|nr:aconitate hydratase [Clostridia bacterium]